MKRIYAKASKVKADFYMDDFPMPMSITVFEEYIEPHNIGLLDADGDPIVAYHVKDPIGFIHWEEE